MDNTDLYLISLQKVLSIHITCIDVPVFKVGVINMRGKYKHRFIAIQVSLVSFCVAVAVAAIIVVELPSILVPAGSLT